MGDSDFNIFTIVFTIVMFIIAVPPFLKEVFDISIREKWLNRSRESQIRFLSKKIEIIEKHLALSERELLSLYAYNLITSLFLLGLVILTGIIFLAALPLPNQSWAENLLKALYAVAFLVSAAYFVWHVIKSAEVPLFLSKGAKHFQETKEKLNELSANNTGTS
jgi:hypothetical protein